MMRDLLFVSALLIGASVVGLPFAATLPRTIAKRLLLAPPLGLAAYAVAVTALYVWGVPTATGGFIALAASVIGSAATARLWIGDLRVRPAAITVGAVTILLGATLAPAWIGGPAFTSFQGNPYDMLNYEGMAYSYGAHSFAEIAGMVPGDALSRTGSFAIDAKNELASRPAVAVVLSSFYRAFYPSTIDAAYPYMTALSVLSWFPIAFLLAACFGAPFAVSATVALCSVVGFFGQYVLDINAWGQLAGMPLGLATLGLFVAYTTGAAKDGHARAGGAVGTAVLVGGLLYLYPEITPVYALAICAAAVPVLALLGLKAIDPLLTMAVAAVAGAAVCLPFLLGTIGSLIQQTSGAVAPQGWADFFDAYLYDVPFKVAVDAHQWLADAVYAADGLLGIYFAYPSHLSADSANAVVLGEAAFAILVLACSVGAAIFARRRPALVPSIAGTAGAAAVAVGLYAAHRPWEAGKALTMGAPLWLALLVLPVLVLRGRRLVLAAPAVALLALHIAFGAARFAVAARIDGIGRHAPYPAIGSMKRSFLFDIAAWRRSLAGCHAISADLDDRVLDRAAEVFLAQQPIPWSSPEDVRGSFTYNEQIGRMAQVNNPDCLITDLRSSKAQGKILELRRPPKAAGTMTYAGEQVELVTSDRGEIDVSGFSSLQPISGGFVRWSAGDGHVYVTVPPGNLPHTVTMGLGMIAPDGDVTVRLNGRELYEGPQWTGPKDITIPADMPPGTWTFDILSGTWSAPHDPRALGVYLSGFALH